MAFTSSFSALPWEHDIHELYADKEAWKEGVHLEFKKSQTKLSDDLWETYSAFANTEGGIIVLGVKDNGTVQGVENVPQQIKVLTDTLNNISKLNLNLSVEPGMVDAVELAGRTVIIIRVPRAKVAQRPIYLNGNLGLTYVRQHSSDTKCRMERLQQMLRDKEEESPTARAIPGTSLACIDAKTWQEYRTLMEGNQYSHAWNRLPSEELMERLEVTVRDEETGKTVLTLAGLLMFGTDDAIRRFRPKYQVNYYGYTIHDLGDVRRRWSDRICQDGTWEANLFQFFFRVLPLISEPLRRPFRLNPDMVTAQGESTGHVAVREALANAIVHADYKGMGGIIVRKYPDRLELSNPGTLLVSRERMLKGGISECRNANMQKMLQAIGVVDKAGTGIDKIMQGWKDQCLDTPTVDEEHDPERIVWTLPYVSLLPKAYESQLSQRFGAERYDRLDAEDRHILLMLASDGAMTHRELHSSIGAMHPAELSKRLSRLVQRDFLSRSGRASATRYQLTGGDVVGVKNACSEHSTPNTVLSTDLGAQCSEKVASALNAHKTNEKSDGRNRVCSESSAPNTVVNAAFSEHCSEVAEAAHGVSGYYAEAEGLPPSVRKELQEFLDRSYNRKARTEELILAICRERWITLPVLSQLLERHPVALRTRYLQPMISAGKLRRKHVSPNHRDQAYMTVD